MNAASVIDGSFRDPAGRVHSIDGRIFRTVSEFGAAQYEAVAKTGFLEELVERKLLVGFESVSDPKILEHFPDAAHVLEHPRLDYISYPYEWSFSLLKAAALLHLSIALRALRSGLSMTDASAYNVQFIGSRPIFIDHLSFKPYQDGEFWTGHRQFCEQFLNPLLLRAKFGIAHNAWYRGNLEGISLEDMFRMLRLRHKLSWRMQSNVVLPARLQKRAQSSNIHETRDISKRRGLPRAGYRGMLLQLRNWIRSLKPADTETSTWGAYDTDNTYEDAENRAKSEFIAKFIHTVKPRTIFDLGCNSGAFSEVALNAGAMLAIGFDFDQTALEKAYHRATDKQLNLLTLFLDAVNPSPDQGWRQQERPGFFARASADAILALAFEHHLAIARNVPLDQVVDWLTGLAPHGIIEFVSKNDPTIKTMLTMRADIFPDYNQDNFETALRRRTRIVEQKQVTTDGRVLYWFERHDT